METKNKNRLVKKFLFFSIGPIGSAAVSFVITPIITWLIAPAEFGKFSMFIVAYNMLMLASLAGVDQSFIRFFYDSNQNERHSLLRSSVKISLSSGIFFAAMAICFSDFFSEMLFGEIDNFAILVLSACLLSGLINRYSLVVLRMKQLAFNFSAFTFFMVALNAAFVIIFALLIGKTFHILILAQMLSIIIVTFIALFSLRSFWFGKGSKKKEFGIKMLLRYGLPFAPTAIITWGFQSMDRFALKTFVSFESLGLYVAAFKIAAILEVLRRSFTMFWTPVALEQFKKQPEDYLFFEKIFKVICAILFVMALLIMMFKDLIILILDSQYHDAVNILPFMLFIPMMHTLSEVTVVGINFTQKTYWHLIIIILAAAINFAGNYLLVPLLEAKGAAISTAFAYFVFFSARTMISRKLFTVNYHLKKTYFIIFLIAGFATLSTFWSFNFIHVVTGVAIIAFCLISYFTTYKDVIYEIKNGIFHKFIKQS